jgi:hypothetical protein
MDDPAKLLRLIPTLRVTLDALSKALPDDPVARHTRALLIQILATLEARNDEIASSRSH